MEVNVPHPETSDYRRAQIATEVAFGELIRNARKSGLPVAPVMGLMYLPTQELTRDFQQACNAILMALVPPGALVGGSDGQNHWIGEDNIPG